MRKGRPPTTVTLRDEERQSLTSLAHRSRSAPQLARRARIILACADGQATTGIAKRLRVSPTTVCKWRTRFLAERIEGLTDEPRPGAPRRVTDEQVEQVVVRTLETTPQGVTHWSTRSMARAMGLSHMTVSRIWHAFGLAQLQLDDIVHEEHGRQYDDPDERPDAKPSAVGHHIEPAIMQSDVDRERQRASGQPGQDRQAHGRTAEPPDPGRDEHPDSKTDRDRPHREHGHSRFRVSSRLHQRFSWEWNTGGCQGSASCVILASNS